jgi:hypothetical protein
VICALWRKRVDGKPNEQDGADPKRESADADLADQLTNADVEKRRQYRRIGCVPMMLRARSSLAILLAGDD